MSSSVQIIKQLIFIRLIFIIYAFFTQNTLLNIGNWVIFLISNFTHLQPHAHSWTITLWIMIFLSKHIYPKRTVRIFTKGLQQTLYLYYSNYEFYFRSNNLSLKYLRFTSLGCKERKFEFVAKTQLISKSIVIMVRQRAKT